MRKFKNRYFYHIFVSPGDAPGAITSNVVWMEDNSMLTMLTNCLAACTHLSSSVSQLFEPEVQKIAVLTYRSPHFCFSWRHPCDYHAMCCMDGKTIHACQRPHSMYLSIFNSFRVIRSLSQCVSPKSLFLPHFCFPWGRPWGNHAKCCMDRKRIRCLQIVSLHVSI